MAKDYVENVEGVYRIAGTRVSLDSIVSCYREGLSPESIVESFPALTLEQVFGAIAFYLANRQVVDEYLREGERASVELRAESRHRNSELIARLKRARHEIRFQADAGLDARIVRGVKRREPLVDFQTGEAAGFRAASDPEVLQMAAGSGRILVTHDKRTMPGHFSTFAAHHTSPGVFIVQRTPRLALS